MDPVKLIDIDGSLHTPFSAIVDDAQRDYFASIRSFDPDEPLDLLCLVRYESGDYDTIPWPMTKPEHRRMLARALYDDREMGTIPDVPEVTLPDGTTFVIDSELQDGEPENTDGEDRDDLRDEGRSDGYGESYAERNA